MEEELSRFMKKVEDAKKGSADLSRDEDLSIALMNLISLEEHFYFSAMKTNDEKYLEMLNSVRNLRKALLKKLVIDPKGEEWCISKHLLAASMRLMEVGTKELAKDSQKEAIIFFKSAYELYSLFFAINMKIVETKSLQAEFEKSLQDEKVKKPLLKKLSEVISKLVDCCKE